MLVPDDLHYSPDHQWVRAEGDVWRVGITEFAQEALGEVTMVHIERPEEAASTSIIEAGHEMGEIEAFKAMTDLYMPVTASVVEYNDALVEAPTTVNSDPYGAGWLCLVRPEAPDDLAHLLDAAAYRELIGVANG